MSRFLTATRSIAVTAFAAATLLSAAGTAFATPDKEPPVSGDPRASAHPGNAKAQECAELFPGSEAVDEADLTVETDGSGTYLDITAVADGTEVVGVIVKGTPAYNRYDAADLGDLPWLDLHAPLASSGEPAQISHWFACGVAAGPTSTTPPTTTTTESPATSAPATTPGGEGPASTSVPVDNAADEEALAETGFAAGWLVPLGAALLLGGGLMLFLMRTRGARR